MAAASITAQPQLSPAAASLPSSAREPSPAPITSDVPPPGTAPPTSSTWTAFHKNGFPKSAALAALGSAPQSPTVASPSAPGSNGSASVSRGRPSPVASPALGAAPAPVHSSAQRPAHTSTPTPSLTPTPVLSKSRVSSSAPSPTFTNSVHHVASGHPLSVPSSRPPPPPGFPSPPRSSSRAPATRESMEELASSLYRTNAASVRQTVRDNWERCLLGSDYHIAFVLNAAIHHASPAIIQKAGKDFGQAFAKTAKAELVSHLSRQDLDEIADLILDKASNAFFDKALAKRPQSIDQIANLVLEQASDGFLDRALAKRLQSIDGRALVNALAKAERLGYTLEDCVDDNPTETALPSFPSATQQYATVPSPTAVPQPQYPQPPQPQAVPPCLKCGRPFTHLSAHDHHVKKFVCSKKLPTIGTRFECQHCGQLFSGSVGLHYHLANKVCGDFGDLPNSKIKFIDPAGSLYDNSIVLSSGGSSPASQYGQMPTTVRLQYGQPVVASPYPGQRQPSMTQHEPSPGAPAVSHLGDPYAILRPERRAALEAELKAAEESFTAKMAEARKGITDPAALDDKLDRLKNSFSTKQSQIRKKYGVKLRERRSRQAVEEERIRMGIPLKHAAYGSSPDAPPAKRAKIDEAAADLASTPYRTPGPILSNVAGGLSVAATPATVDPTAATASRVNGSPRPRGAGKSASPRLSGDGYRPLSSGKGKELNGSPARSGSHGLPSMTALAREALTGSKAQPLDVNDDSDSDSSDGDIPGGTPEPQSLPPKAPAPQPVAEPTAQLTG